MPVRLTRADVEHIAALAHLALTDAEIELFLPQLASILEYAEQIRNLDTSGVAPTASVLGRLPVDRGDDPVPCLPRDEALANAPDASPDRSLLRVPRVIA